ncbi:MAG: neutral/alkaline non-lysosomal ceramidase N-terminal domain-containing protein [Pirellulales bacterium]
MPNRITRLFLFHLALCLCSTTQAAGWKAGAAKVNITPQTPMWMSGYGGRDHVAEGKLTDLWVKCLLLEDPAGGRAAIVTLDLCGIDRPLSQAVCQEIEKKYGLERRRILLNCSHTHTGPVVGGNLAAMYFLDETQQKLVDDYAVTLRQNMIDVVGQAIEALAPCELAWGQGKATFAVNRRNNVEANVPMLREAGQLKGPVDHAAPVLRVTGADGELRAVLFGYACHATVLSFYQWSGDWPGFAQMLLEQNHPGAIALFWAGCGADQNPLPRRTVELAAEYGHRLAEVVETVLDGPLAPIAGNLAADYAEVPAPFAQLPTREQLEKETESKDVYAASRSKRLLAQIDGGQPLSPTYPYPVQAWKLGDGPLFISLGGEVVIDYALRIKAELGTRTWIAGYSNDVMAYIPSRRVLGEGGYEGASSMTIYGQPTTWGPEIEETIMRQIHASAKAVGGE